MVKQIQLTKLHYAWDNFSCLLKVLGLVRSWCCTNSVSWFNTIIIWRLNIHFDLVLVIFQIAFNPITNNSIKKTLLRICRLEHCNVTAEEIDLITKASGGDIRHAIMSLQLFLLKSDPKINLLSSCCTPYSKERGNELNALDNGLSLQFGRDETLSLFHALGKFLHNKRETENAIGLGVLQKDVTSSFNLILLEVGIVIQ